MGKKPQRQDWPEVKKLCRLNQDDIEMAKRLGFGPDMCNWGKHACNLAAHKSRR